MTALIIIAVLVLVLLAALNPEAAARVTHPHIWIATMYWRFRRHRIERQADSETLGRRMK